MRPATRTTAAAIIRRATSGETRAMAESNPQRPGIPSRRTERRALVGALALSLLGPLLVSTAQASSAPPDPVGRRAVVLGRSIESRPIIAIETGDLDAKRRALVVGCIHGDEPAGIAVAELLARLPPPQELALWIIPVLNPDGVTAGTRGNADRVDLNRNFPWRWRPLSGTYYSGPHPLSEPESRIAYRLVKRLKPNVSIWFHQHLDVVDASGGKIAVEQRFAKLTGLPLVRLAREPGSVIGWTNHEDPAGTAFVVELPAGQLRAGTAARYARAVIAVAQSAGDD